MSNELLQTCVIPWYVERVREMGYEISHVMEGGRGTLHVGSGWDAQRVLWDFTVVVSGSPVWVGFQRDACSKRHHALGEVEVWYPVIIYDAENEYRSWWGDESISLPEVFRQFTLDLFALTLAQDGVYATTPQQRLPDSLQQLLQDLGWVYECEHKNMLGSSWRYKSVSICVFADTHILPNLLDYRLPLSAKSSDEVRAALGEVRQGLEAYDTLCRTFWGDSSTA